MRPLLRELLPLFERAHGAVIEVEFRLSAALKRAIRDGAVFDIAILPRPELDDLIALGAIVRGSAADVQAFPPIAHHCGGAPASGGRVREGNSIALLCPYRRHRERPRLRSRGELRRV